MQERIDPDQVADPRVLSVVWNLIRGGTEGQCARVAMGVAARGAMHRVAVFQREGFFLEPVEAACGPVYEVGIQRMFTLETWRAIKRLAAFIREERFDLVHLWDIDAVIFGSVAARMAGVPYLTSRRDMAEIYPVHKLALMKRADRKAVGIVVNAQAIATLVQQLGIRTPVHCLPNILDVEEFDRQAAESLSGLPIDKKLVGMVARLDPEKDAQLFLHAMQDVLNRHADVHAVIAGDGEERERLASLAKSLAMDDRVTFLGEFHAVPALVRHLEIGVLVPRSNEGLSNTILEYMAGAKAVIATDCGGNRELVVPGKTGILVPVGDAVRLAEDINSLLNNADRCRQLGENARAVIEQRHAPAVVVDKFSDLYRHVAGAIV